MTIKHTYYECKCNGEFCQFCAGGLGWCTVCDGFEGELGTHCPGQKMTKDEKYNIYKLGADYRDNEWHHSGGPMDHRSTKA